MRCIKARRIDTEIVSSGDVQTNLPQVVFLLVDTLLNRVVRFDSLKVIVFEPASLLSHGAAWSVVGTCGRTFDSLASGMTCSEGLNCSELDLAVEDAVGACLEASCGEVGSCESHIFVDFPKEMQPRRLTTVYGTSILHVVCQAQQKTLYAISGPIPPPQVTPAVKQRYQQITAPLTFSFRGYF